MVVGFILVRCVHLGAPWGSLGSLGRTIAVVVFIRVRSGACWGWTGSFAFVGFIVERHVGRPVHSGSLGLFG